MVLDFILLTIAIVGFGGTGYLDLRYTEFPDWIPYGIIVSALGFRSIFSILQSDFYILLNSVLVGLAFLGFGLLLYFLKQWGDGDAWLLGALGFLFPQKIFFEFSSAVSFPIVLLFNLFFVAFFYLVIYALALGSRSKKVRKDFVKLVKKNSNTLLYSLILLVVVWSGFIFYLIQYISSYRILPILLILPLFIFIIFFTQYGKVIEKNLFKKKISTKKLRVGDVLLSKRWRGLTEKEVRKLRRKGGKVWIKEGIRFAPVFLITVLITLFLGSPLLWFI